MNMKEANELLITIAETNEKLMGLYFSLRSKAGVKEAHHGFNLRKYDNGCSIEMFVEAEIDGNVAYCWWTDIEFSNQTWIVKTSLLQTQDGEQRRLSGLLESHGSNLEEFYRELKSASEIIRNSVDDFGNGERPK